MNAIADTIAGKWARLLAMPPSEVRHRLRERATTELQRLGLRRNEPAMPADFRSCLEASAPRFYCGAQWPRDFVKREFPQWIDRALDEAERLCRHEVELLGFGCMALGDKIDWYRDPVTGHQWERRFWSDYRLEHDPQGRDSKVIHELNRQQHLPRLAKAFYWSRKERYAAEAIAQIESWIEQNPVGIGVNWNSSLEIAIRVTSWLWTLFLLLPSRALSPESAQRIGASLFAQLEHVREHTSLYSSPNTHLIGEAAALFVAGTIFDGQEIAHGWRDCGAALLASEAEKQILEDGVYAELSTYYHCYALAFYLQALTLARHNRFHFANSPLIESRVEAMLDFLMHVTQPDGSFPRLGDDDGGRDLALANRDYRSFNDALSLGAALFSRADFKFCTRTFSEETFWLAGPSDLHIQDEGGTFEQLEAREPASTSAFFQRAGLYVARSGWGPRASHLTFDCGGLGMLTGGHSHADSLAVTLFANGRELLVDPGTCVYNGAPGWREYFRSTRAHNTVTVDHRDQADAGGAFRWKTRINARRVTPPVKRWAGEIPGDARKSAQGAASRPVEYLEASHGGYMRLEQGVLHRRRVLRIDPDCWILADELTGDGDHTCDFWYHFGETVDSAELEHEAGGLSLWSGGAGFGLSIFASLPLQVELLTGQRESSIAGWSSRGYGHKTASLSLRATAQGSLPIGALTVLALAAARPAIARVRADVLCSATAAGDPNRVTACSIACGVQRDLVVLSDGNSEINLEGFRMKGELFWIRIEGGAPKHALAVRPARLEFGGRDLLAESRTAVHGKSASRAGSRGKSEGIEDPTCAASAAF